MDAREKLYERIFKSAPSEDAMPKSTKGIEKNMHAEIENLVRKAYNEGKAEGARLSEDRKAELRGEGVIELYGCLVQLIGNIIHDVYPIDDGKGPTELQRAEMLHKVLDLFDDKCPFDLINQADAEEALREKQEKRDAIEVGDIVEDCTGNRCTVTNTDTHIHVVYENGKTHKWDKDAVFLKVGKAKMMEIVEE